MLSSRKLLARRPLMVTAIVAVMATWAPAALATWSAPATVSAPHDAISDLQLASGPNGDLLAWRYYDLIPPAMEIFGAPGARYAVAPPGGSFGPERQLPASYATGPLVNLGEGGVAQLIMRRTGVDTTEPEVALGNVDGVFGAPQRIHASVWGQHASLAGNLRGELLLAWISSPRSGQRQVWVSVRLAGRRFGTPKLLSAHANGLSVTVAVGPPDHSPNIGGCSCDMVVAFDSKNGRMLASVLPHGPHAWGPVQDIGPAAEGTINEVAPYIGRDGRVTVAWYHEQLSEGGPLGPGYTQVAMQPPGAHRFGPPQTLERDPPTATIGGEPMVVGEGGRVLAFLAQPGTPVSGFTPAVVKVAYRKGNRFTAPETISPPGQQASELAAAEGPIGPIVTWIGRAISLPSSPSTSNPAVYAAVSATQVDQLEAPQQVSPAEHATAPIPVYSSNGSRWIVAWTGRPQDQSPLTTGPLVVRASFCQLDCR